MGRHGREQGNGGLAQEAARIFCEEQLTDYRAAKQKALARLNLGPRTPLPDNAAVQRSVLEYQRLFGGADYHRRLHQLREKALAAMDLLRDFSPRLAGAVVSGAITRAHAVQLHVFSEPAEAVDIFLQNKGIRYEQDDRQYRYGNGRERMIPRVRFEAGDVRVVVAIFPEGEIKRAPINPADGLPYARLDGDAARLLLQQTVSA
jgi:hypothetical protein